MAAKLDQKNLQFQKRKSVRTFFSLVSSELALKPLYIFIFLHNSAANLKKILPHNARKDCMEKSLDSVPEMSQAHRCERTICSKGELDFQSYYWMPKKIFKYKFSNCRVQTCVSDPESCIEVFPHPQDKHHLTPPSQSKIVCTRTCEATLRKHRTIGIVSFPQISTEGSCQVRF